MPSDRRIAAAFLAACSDELTALKPGNVHRYADGHGMTVADFAASAAAAAPAMAGIGSGVGQRIGEAVAASWARVGCNTNLGIVLLCAPLALAAERLAARAGRVAAADLARATATVLDGLTIEDAALAYRAIAMANPGGLGRLAREDVREPPQRTLREAMGLAADRDRIARQYVTGFADIFGFALPCFDRQIAAGATAECATSGLFLALLARWPDSHLVRKFGDSVAQTVTREAGQYYAEYISWAAPASLRRDLLDWDSRLKAQGLNPGSSADLTVATLFAYHLRQP